MDIALLACCKRKLDTLAPARDLYQGTLFKHALAYVEQIVRPDRTFILSAAYHVVTPCDRIWPYDKTLNDFTAREVRTWGGWVQTKLHVQHAIRVVTEHRWIILAGRTYRKGLYWLDDVPTDQIVLPLASVGGIGKQIAWLKEQLQCNHQPPLLA